MTMRRRVLVGVLWAMLPVALSAQVTYCVELPCFRVGQDRYLQHNGTTAAWSASGAYEVTLQTDSTWMEYDAFPGAKPIPGPAALELETEGDFAGTLEVHFTPFPDGKPLVFKAAKSAQANVTRFKTRLDPARLYQLRLFVVSRSGGDGKPWRMGFRRLTAAYRTTEAQALRFDCETGNPLRLVRQERGERAAFAIDNLSTRSVAVEGMLSLKGSLGEPKALPVKVTLPPKARTSLPLPCVALKGVWRISGELRAGDGSTVPVEARFAYVDDHAVTPKQPFGTFRLGVNENFGRFTDVDRRLTIDAFVACGAKLVRGETGTFMETIQPNGPDDADFSRPDRLVGDLEAAGLSLDTLLLWNPAWAARPGDLSREWKRWRLGRVRDGLFEQFCEKLSRHFGTRIDYYEVGNEWDLDFCGTPEDAIAVQKEAYAGLKRGCADVCVIPNGWAVSEDNDQVVRSGHKGFREAALRGMAPYMDVMTIHMHGAFAPYVRQIEERLFPLMKRTGLGGKRWYSNETSMSSLWEERAPALLVWKKILYAWSAGSQDYIWYNMRGTGWDPKDVEQGYGMVTADYRPRETFAAYAALATAFGGKTFRQTLFRKASRFCLLFAQEGGLTLGAWDESATPDGVRVPVKTDARTAVRIDVFGNRTTLAVRDGCVDFVFGAHPAALVLDGASSATADCAALSDIPPPHVKATVIPPGYTTRRPDFVLDAHSQVTDYFQANPAEVHRLWKGPEDLSAKVWLGHDARGLDVRLDVTDDVHVPPKGGVRQYEGDDVQLAFASHLQRGHWEFGLAHRADGEGEVYCWLAPGGFETEAAAKAVRLKTRREGTVTTYEAHFPYATLGFEPALMRQGFRFNVMVNDNDSDGRDAAIEIRGGSFEPKDFGLYPFVRFE